MKHGLSGTAMILTLLLAGAAWSQEKTQEKKEVKKDDLPYLDKIVWDVKLFEESAESFTVVKRSVDKQKVTWVLELKTEGAAGSFFQFGGGFNRYFVRFTDEDRVTIVDVVLGNGGGSFERGQRVRVSLTLPDIAMLEKTKAAKLMHR